MTDNTEAPRMVERVTSQLRGEAIDVACSMISLAYGVPFADVVKAVCDLTKTDLSGMPEVLTETAFSWPCYIGLVERPGGKSVYLYDAQEALEPGKPLAPYTGIVEIVVNGPGEGEQAIETGKVPPKIDPADFNPDDEQQMAEALDRQYPDDPPSEDEQAGAGGTPTEDGGIKPTEPKAE